MRQQVQKTLSITCFVFIRQPELAKLKLNYQLLLRWPVLIFFSGFLDYRNAKVNSRSYPFFYALSNELSQCIPLHLKKKSWGRLLPPKEG